MPIYVYKCSACGHGEDVLQKMSDPLLTVCPKCGHHTYQKQVTAAGFQLKGTGWYVTDFRGNGGKPPESMGTAPHPHHDSNDGAGSARDGHGSVDGPKTGAPSSAALPKPKPKADKSSKAAPAASASSSAS